MLNGKKIAVVFGATGNQGGSVARALAWSGEYQVRGVSRDLDSQRARDLIQDGVDLFDLDLNNRSGLSLVMHNADMCFVNTATDFDNPACLESEIAQGCLIADYCKSEGVKHVVFSTQLNSYKVCGLMARHLVAKAEIESYMRQIGLPLTALIMPVYFEDFLNIFKPTTRDGRTYEVELPMGLTPLDTMSVEDVGRAVLNALAQGDRFMDKTITVCGDKLTTREIAQVFSKYLRPKVFKDKQITAHEWVHTHGDIKGCSDWANMFQFQQRVDQKYNLSTTKELNQGLQSFDAWVGRNQARINAVL